MEGRVFFMVNGWLKFEVELRLKCWGFGGIIVMFYFFVGDNWKYVQIGYLWDRKWQSHRIKYDMEFKG